ncbi:hypothetical protein DBR43_09590 [Pedobacter sp. KBW06]|nr:hypothetical protein DBR43_09590 [Pedobacter sp. KBW06]
MMKHEKLLNHFLSMAKNDDLIQRSHLSLLIAIYHQWQNNDYRNPVNITRRSLMLTSKIKSFATYHKCIKDLEALAYFRYEPCYKPTGSFIHWPKDLLAMLN